MENKAILCDYFEIMSCNKFILNGIWIRRIFICIVVFLSNSVYCQNNSVVFSVGYPTWSKSYLENRSKNSKFGNSNIGLHYKRDMKKTSIAIGIEYFSQNINLKYTIPVPKWAASSARYHRNIYSLSLGLENTLCKFHNFSISISQGIQFLSSNKMQVNVSNEASNVSLDSTLRAQDYYGIIAFRQGVTLSYRLNNKVKISLNNNFDIRIRDFYKESTSWSIWINKGDGNKAYIISCSFSYLW